MSCRSSRKYINYSLLLSATAETPTWQEMGAPITRSWTSFTPLYKSGNAADETSTQILGLFQKESSTATSTIHRKRAFVAWTDFKNQCRHWDTRHVLQCKHIVCCVHSDDVDISGYAGFPMAEHLRESFVFDGCLPLAEKRICPLMLRL